MSTALATATPKPPPPLRLYEATAEWAAVQDALEEAGGEMDAELEARFDAIEQALPAKVEAIVFIHQELLRRGEAAKAEADRLYGLAQVRFNAAERLKEYLKRCLERAGIPKVETDRCKVRFQRNGGRVPISWRRPMEELPLEFQRVEILLDTEAAREVLERDGALPDGFLVEERGTHLRIS